jgi:ferritin
MVLNKTMETALNKQINAEMYASHIYLSMSAYFEDNNLGGFASWMRKQAKEETEHAMRIYDYVVEKGGRVKLDTIQKPPTTWKSPLDAFNAAYEHERKVTAMIDNLVSIARKLKDNATESMLKWFVDEQVEEEDQTDEIVQKLKMIGDSKHAIFMLDNALGQRK